MSFQAQFEHWISAPLDQVFPFFADPHNLPRIMPPWMDVRLEEIVITAPPGSSSAKFAGPGSRLIASYRALPFLPIRIRSGARITAFSMNEFFEDVQGQGPFRSWHHRHEFTSETRNGIAGTRLRDQVEYEIGFGILGGLINRLFIAPQMRRTFAYRQQIIEHLLISPP